MTSKRSTTMFNHYQEVLRELKDIYSRAALFMHPHREILEDLSKMYSSNHYKRLNQLYRGEIKGYAHALADFHYRHLIWVFKYNGKIYKNFSKLPKKERETYHGNREKSGLFVYHENPNKEF